MNSSIEIGGSDELIAVINAFLADNPPAFFAVLIGSICLFVYLITHKWEGSDNEKI